jgi:hypothetical protein
MADNHSKNDVTRNELKERSVDTYRQLEEIPVRCTDDPNAACVRALAIGDIKLHGSEYLYRQLEEIPMPCAALSEYLPPGTLVYLQGRPGTIYANEGREPWEGFSGVIMREMPPGAYVVRLDDSEGTRWFIERQNIHPVYA